jgi:hypothetical protein
MTCIHALAAAEMFQKLLEKRQKFKKRVNSGEAEDYDLHTCTCCSSCMHYFIACFEYVRVPTS